MSAGSFRDGEMLGAHKTCADVPASHGKAVPDEEIQEVFKLFDQVGSQYMLSMYLHG